ncbi:hypothetical protein [Moraxella caviae]|uniref:hypothetical protein n=1 Tax=Moraxella caviae TaxID=34060 RepID=UPI001300CAE2|nr:hypothetical protein [Moraxella caviae]
MFIQFKNLLIKPIVRCHAPMMVAIFYDSLMNQSSLTPTTDTKHADASRSFNI